MAFTGPLTQAKLSVKESNEKQKPSAAALKWSEESMSSLTTCDSSVNRKDVQLNQLAKLEEKFAASQSEVSRVQERIKALEIAVQMGREVCRVPFLEKYCTLDKVCSVTTLNTTDMSDHIKQQAHTGKLCFYIYFPCQWDILAAELCCVCVCARVT